MVRADQNVVAHAHVAEQRDVLECAPSPVPPCGVGPGSSAIGLEKDVAIGVAVEAADAVEQRGLARTFGPIRPQTDHSRRRTKRR